MGRILASWRGEGEVGQRPEGGYQRYAWFLVPMGLLLTALRSLLEVVWAEFILKNPLQVDVELTNLTVAVKEAEKAQTDEPREGLVEVEEIDKVFLASGEQRTVSGFLRSIFIVLILLAHQTTDPNLHQIPSTNEIGTHRTHLQIPCFCPLLRVPRYPRPTTQRHCSPKAKQDLCSRCVRRDRDRGVQTTSGCELCGG